MCYLMCVVSEFSDVFTVFRFFPLCNLSHFWYFCSYFVNIYEGLHGHVVYIFWFINIFDVLAVEMYNTFLCFLIATANGPPWGNASGCVQQVPSLANTPNDEKNLSRRQIHEREKRLWLNLKKEGEEQKHSLPAWAGWSLMDGFSSQSELELLMSRSAWGRGLEKRML